MEKKPLTIEDITPVVGPSGIIILMSKSSYRKSHPDNRVFFNGNIFDETGKKVWYGDIDLTKSKDKLQKVLDASSSSCIFITQESPWRWKDSHSVFELESDQHVVCLRNFLHDQYSEKLR